MRIALLSAGPRLPETFNPSEPYQARIGINAAATLYPCQYWSCGDAQTFGRHIGDIPEAWPTPTLFTLTESDAHFRTPSAVAKRFAAHRVLLWTTVRDRVQPPQEALTWSVTAALALAVDLGATDIEVHGHYYPGETPGIIDVAGHQNPTRPHNHARVIQAWAETKAWAQGLGVRILERFPPDIARQRAQEPQEAAL